MQTMGIDIGTTTISIVLLNTEDGSLIAGKTIEHNSFLPPDIPGGKIQDPEKIWELTGQAVREFMDAYGIPVGIGLTGQMHGMLYVDAKGEAVSPLYTWQDERGNEPYVDYDTDQDVKPSLTYAEYLSKHVGPAATGYGLTTHFYLQQRGMIPVGAEKMTTISDYIGRKLCGSNTEPVMGVDMAASWGCFDLEKGDFKRQELLRAGVDISYLPPVEREREIVGAINVPGNLGEKCLKSDRIPVSISLGDNQASVMGSVKDMYDTVVINVGTGSQISMGTKYYIPCEGSIELRPCTKDGYIMVGCGLCGGRAYAMLEEFYRQVPGNSEDSLYHLMAAQARDFLDTYGMEKAWKIHTTFSGTRDNPGEKGSIYGIGVENFHPGAMTLGMLQGILEELHDQYLQMCEKTGGKATHLMGSGNGIRKNPLMRQLAEELFGMKMEIPIYKEEAACGAALYAAEAVERLSLKFS